MSSKAADAVSELYTRKSAEASYHVLKPIFDNSRAKKCQSVDGKGSEWLEGTPASASLSGSKKPKKGSPRDTANDHPEKIDLDSVLKSI